MFLLEELYFLYKKKNNETELSKRKIRIKIVSIFFQFLKQFGSASLSLQKDLGMSWDLFICISTDERSLVSRGYFRTNSEFLSFICFVSETRERWILCLQYQYISN